MKNRDKFRQMSDRELADFLCEVVEGIIHGTDINTCDVCPVRNFCYKGHNGFLAYLNADTDINADKRGLFDD